MAQNCVSTCTGNLGENIFADGDFGQGAPNVLPYNPNLAPGYLYQFNPPPDDGFYTITNNTSNWGSFAASTWIKILDNGPEPNGYMMVVNASYQPGLFYEKEVPVCENTLYEFSIDVIAMNLPSAAQFVIHPDVSFLINGLAVCSTGKVPVDAAWHTYRFSFTTAPGVSKVKLSLRNNSPGGYGNDLAIDNISFRACGPNIDVPATMFFCPGKPLQLSAQLSNSPYNTAFFQWQYQPAGSGAWNNLPASNSPALSIPNPMDGDAYRLLVANSAGNLDLPFCRAVSFPVELAPEDLSGYAIGGSDTILCNQTPARLEGGPFALFHWSTGASGPVLEATAPGWYAVTVTSANGCTATDSLYVYEVELTAQAEATDPVCPGDSSGHIRVLNWQGGEGPVRFSLNGGTYQSQPFFPGLPAGDYTVATVDSLGCRFEQPFVLSDPPALLIDLGEDQTVYVCDSLFLPVSANFPLVHYQWEPVAGLSCKNCPAPLAMPLHTTVYTLFATDDRGCRALDSLLLTVLPRLDVYAPNVFRQDFSDSGENNYFALFTSKSAVLVRRMDIFDRWGGLVFHRELLPPGAGALRWDGTDPRGDPLPEGVYVWVAELEFTDGITQFFSGDVTLLRR